MTLKTVPHKLICCLLASFSSLGIYAQDYEDQVEVTTNIKEVTVFLKGAIITRTAKVTMHAGDNHIVFPGLAYNIDANSIQVGGKGNITIMSVGLKNNYLKQHKETPRVVMLKDSLKSLRFKLGIKQGMLNVLGEEKDMILSNKMIGSAQLGVDIEALEDAAVFYRDRLMNITQETMITRVVIESLIANIQKLDQEVNSIKREQIKGSGEIFLNVRSATVQAGLEITMSYYTYDARWTPSYNIRATENQNVKLNFKGEGNQSTGVDWKDVNLVLSTSNPSLSGNAPIMHPWKLRYEQPRSYVKSDELKRMAGRGIEQEVNVAGGIVDGKFKDKGEDTRLDANTAADFTTKDVQLTNVSYRINLPYTIPSSMTAQYVDIQNYQLKSTYKNYCIPKLNEDVFLLAEVTEWDQHNLLSGNANIFFDGTFVGKTYINTAATNDTLNISLGRDKLVVVKRTKLMDYSKKKIVGSNKVITNAFEISFRNKKCIHMLLSRF